MKVGEIDWSVIRGAIAFLGVAVLVCGALAYTGIHFVDQAARVHATEKRKLNSVRAEYQAIDDEQRIMETYLPQYESLTGRGIIGAEKRLDWIETLRSAAERIKLPSLRYELSPQGPYKAQFPVSNGVYKVYASQMRLEAGMLHEGDLPVLLRELNRNAKGLYSVSRCFIRRSAPELQMRPRAQNINASCVLDWVTIRQPGEGEGA